VFSAVLRAPKNSCSLASYSCLRRTMAWRMAGRIRLGPQPGLGRRRLGPGQSLVDQAQVSVDPDDGGVDHRVTAAEAPELVELVGQQGAAYLGAAQVAAGRQLLDLDVEQQRLALDVDQGAGHVRLLAEDRRGPVDVDVGLQDQRLDDQDEHDQHAAEGELERAAPAAQDAAGVGGPRPCPARGRSRSTERAGHGPRRPSSRRRSRSTGPGCGPCWSCRGTRSGSGRTGRPACACRRPWWPAASGSCARRPP
jgi:hypothetical protein